MKTQKKYVYFLIAVVAIYTFYELRRPTELDWSETYHFRDQIPFGTKVTHDLLQEIVGSQEAKHTFRSPYELFKIEGDTSDNLLMLSSVMEMDRQDTDALLEYIATGKTVLLGAESFGGALRDSLNFGMAFDEQLVSTNVTDVQAALAGESMTGIHYTNDNFPQDDFEFPSAVASTSFTNLKKDDFEILAENDEGQAVLVRYKRVENGALYLSSMPLALTNYFVLDEKTTSFAEALLSLFPQEMSLSHNEYYQMGRMESSSIMRFVLRHESLRWAYFLLIGTVLFFILFEIKRRQRIIPIVSPLKNTTLEFVDTLGRLHYRQSDHANLAKKRVHYWLEFVRTHYNLGTTHLDESFADELTRKSGKDKRWLELLIKTASKVREGQQISESELMAFEKLLNKFYGLDKTE